MPILEMKDICKSFSGVYANDHVSISAEQGKISALLGENGAGKTTLVNILFGIYTADCGTIEWKGKSVAFASPKDAIEAGIGMVQQHFSLIQKMTVLDNIILNLRGNRFFLNRAAAEQRVVRLAEKYGLHVDPKARVCDLSVGEQQRVEILKALYRNVELLILDEPTGVLTPQETAQFFDVLRNLKNEGYAVIIITHRMSEIMAISDQVTILRDGKKIIDLVTAETSPAELSRYMIGRDLKEQYEIESNTPEGEMLSICSLSLSGKGKHHPLHDINLNVRKGEILGIAGVEGNGQKELSEVITGIAKGYSGDILLEDRNINLLSVRKRYERGIAYISDDRHRDSLVMDMNLTENLMLREYCCAPYSRSGVINPAAMQDNADAMMQKYQIRASGKTGAGTVVKLMSGGNQQKLIIARELSEGAKLIVAGQPTRGLDIGATEFVRKLLVSQRNEGKSVLLISADLEEILALSDRIAVMFGGRIAGVLNRSEATVQQIGLLMGGMTGKEAIS